MIRFIVDVDRLADGSGWQSTVTSPRLDSTWKFGPRMMHRLGPVGAGFPKPADCVPTAADSGHALCSTTEATPIGVAYNAITQRNPGESGVREFGRYLFDALIGSDAWDKIKKATVGAGEKSIELALSWSQADSELHRLNWEMMHSGETFLAAGYPGASVAITRLVRGTQTIHAEQLDSPPRVLFVVGSQLLDPEIRPGAEYLGILRQLSRDNRAIRPSLLEAATPARLRERLQEFKPQVVHFICHGDNENGRGYLRLQKDEGEVSGDKYAEQLLQLLLVDYRDGQGPRLPPIVVLSACNTANGGRQLWRPDEAAPLASQLLEGGVPIVLGMAGRVADVACRLFTRRFGEAIVLGQPLVAATAEARRATFADGEPPHLSVDWAFPTVFLAQGVDPDYAPIVPATDDLAALIAGLITGYDLEESPVFCGRHEFFEYFDALFESKQRVLAAYVAQRNAGFGRRRLLRELAIHALRAGHVPVPVPWRDNETLPNTLEGIGRALRATIDQVRLQFNLPLPATRQLLLLLSLTLEQAKVDPRLDDFIRSELLANQRLTPAALRLAIRKDLTSLASDARAKYPHIAAAHGRVVVLLNKVEQYDQAALPLFQGMLDGFGFGNADEPIPVVLTFAYGTPLDDVLRPLTEKGQKAWLNFKELKPLQDYEDVMACEQVLMNPYSDQLAPGVSEKAWAIAGTATSEKVAKWERYFGMSIRGTPGELVSHSLYVVATMARDEGVLVEATDEDILKRMRM